MNTKNLALVTFVVGIVSFVIGGIRSDSGYLIGGSIMISAGLLALRDAR